MPSTFEPEPQDSVTLSVSSKTIKHPNDVCECGHTRSEHNLITLACKTNCSHGEDCQDEFCNGYADDCVTYKRAKTALQAAVEATFGTEPSITEQCNQICQCGHAAIVHTGQTGNCLAHGTGPQEASHCVEFRPGDDPEDYPETICTCGPGGAHTYQDPTCVAAQDGYPSPLPQVLPETVPAYRVIYATAGGTLHAIDLPYGVNAAVIDGQLRLWHAGVPILAIQANITSTQEPR